MGEREIERLESDKERDGREIERWEREREIDAEMGELGVHDRYLRHERKKI